MVPVGPRAPVRAGRCGIMTGMTVTDAAHPRDRIAVVEYENLPGRPGPWAALRA
ncbi:hypothetical protein GCM10010293_33210 [Streptomyces griseoflavus]|nr:hypothetical protein GCM10010293_33210 [Streptomyces griseoflavus]